MTFFAPGHLWALLGVGVIMAVYVVADVRRRRLTNSFIDPELLAAVAPRRPGWRRYATAFGIMLTLLAIALAWARPAASTSQARRITTVMAAIDVSASMAAEDVKPNRLTAAQGAASAFVRSLPANLRIGLVVFSDSATITVAPSDDRNLIVAAIKDTEASGGTAIGEAIFKSLDALSTEHGVPPPAGLNAVYRRLPAAAIVLLSDGATNAGRPNSAAVAAARDAGVPVSTIAFGTDQGFLKVGDSKLKVPVDAAALELIAKSTSGHSYRAETNAELQEVYAGVGTELVHVTRHRTITSWFVGAAIIFAGLTAIGSLTWFGRLPS
jgi:Ca-activated chloride channel family protein